MNDLNDLAIPQTMDTFRRYDNVTDVRLLRLEPDGKSFHLRLTLDDGHYATVLASLMFPSLAVLSHITVDLIIRDDMQTLMVQDNRVVLDGSEPWFIGKVDLRRTTGV